METLGMKSIIEWYKQRQVADWVRTTVADRFVSTEILARI